MQNHSEVAQGLSMGAKWNHRNPAYFALTCRDNWCCSFAGYAQQHVKFGNSWILVVVKFPKLIDLRKCMFLRKKYPLQVFLKLVSAIFLSNFYFFHQMIALQKLWKMFISSKKVFLFSRYSIFVIFSLSYQNFQIQKDKWKWDNLWCHELACINL